MPTSVINFLDAIYPLSLPLKEALHASLIQETFPRRHLLLREGQQCEYVYFVKKGLLRAYYRKGRSEVTSWFMKENDVVVSVSGFFQQWPSHENIEILEDAELVYIHYNKLQEIYDRFVEFNVVGRRLTEKYYALSEERLVMMRKQSTRERYRFFLEKYPELLQRVPVSCLASYLGMSPWTLSKVRARY